jgi:transcriptional regulator with XRE-family HTH domain
MEITARIGKRVIAARERFGWSQSDLARHLKRSRQHVSQIEQGKQQPRAELLLALAGLLETTTDYLLGRTEEVDACTPRRSNDVPQGRR